jgi:diguanylate cyclase (GGDEF)-like protein
MERLIFEQAGFAIHFHQQISGKVRLQTMTNLQLSRISIIAGRLALMGAWLCALLLLEGQAQATTPLNLDALAPSYAVAPHVDFLQDASAALNFSDITSPAWSEKFRPVNASGNNEINFGYSGAAYWLRLVINAPVAIHNDMLLEVGFPSLDHVEFYAQPEFSGQWEKQEAGDLIPFSARPLMHRNFIFTLHPHQAGLHTVYLRIASSGTLTIPLRIWQTDAFDRHNQNSYAALALYFGMLLALMLYNLLLYFSLRDRNYLAYVCVVVGMAVGQLSLTGLGNQFLWPHWPAWGNVALPVGFALTAFFAALFTRGFLNTAKMAPRHDRVIVVLAWISGLLALSPAIVPYTWVAILTSLLGIVFPAVAVSTGVICLRRGQPGAPYFLLSWTLLLCGTAILGLRNLGWVSTNFFTLYSMLIGSALEILLLSFALADRIQILRHEKEQAQNEALAISQRAERDLTARVAARTLELSESNTRLLSSQEHERNRNKVLEGLAQGAPIHDILTILAQAIEHSSKDKLCSILLLDETGKFLQLAAAPSLPNFYTQAIDGQVVADEKGPCGTAAFKGERVIVENIQTHPCWASYRELAKQAELTSCWSEPILSSKREVLGTFAIYQRHAGGPDKADIELIQQACHLASIAIERKRVDDQMWSHANYDLLTLLPNRRLFHDRLQQDIKKTQRAGLSLALMFIDLDLFKEVNDTLGHDVGDLLLIDVAHRISSCVRDSDTVARISGDEFTVILPELTENNRTENVAQNILQTLTQPFIIGKEKIYISASIGITRYPDDATEVEGLLKNADQAMYAAKNQGRNGFSYFTNRMQEEAQIRMHMIKDLRDALSANQFQVYFQPIVDMANGRIVKAEALLRWFHPGHGLVSPSLFIPLAEETGLISELGDWVFKEAARYMLRWHQLGYSCIQVSVNKSPKQFVSDNCHAGWLDYLQLINLPTACMVVEITEGLLLNERSDVSEKLLKFRDAGIQVAIDDFGTGYSSLSYLKKFHIDFLKIDQSFVRDLATDPNDLALSEAIIVMAHKLGIKVIAEGVETIGQRDMLAAAGCDFAQGYLFARPMPAEDFEALMAER